MFEALFRLGLSTRLSTNINLKRVFEPYCNRVKPRTFLESFIICQCQVKQETRREMTSKYTPPTVTAASVDDSVNNISLNLFSFCNFVKLDCLTAEEKLIHSKHLKALQNHQEMYKDPATGYSVLTRLAHLKRGECCGNACRHCPYGQKNVPESVPKKTYNSAFFV